MVTRTGGSPGSVMVGTPQEACPRRLGRGELRLDLAAPDAGGLRGGLGRLVACPSPPYLGGDGRVVLGPLLRLGQRVRGLGRQRLEPLLLGDGAQQLGQEGAQRYRSSSASSAKSLPSPAGARTAPFAGLRYCEPRQPSSCPWCRAGARWAPPSGRCRADGLAGPSPPASRACVCPDFRSCVCPASGRGSGVDTNRSHVSLPCRSGS